MPFLSEYARYITKRKYLETVILDQETEKRAEKTSCSKLPETSRRIFQETIISVTSNLLLLILHAAPLGKLLSKQEGPYVVKEVFTPVL